VCDVGIRQIRDSGRPAAALPGQMDAEDELGAVCARAHHRVRPHVGAPVDVHADVDVAARSNREIARTLSIGESTVQTHISNVLTKLDLRSRTQAALWAVREGLLEL